MLAGNSFGTKTVLLIAVLGFIGGRPDFLDIALLYALVNFIGTIAVLKFFRYRNLGIADSDGIRNGGEITQGSSEKKGGNLMEIIINIASWFLVISGVFFIFTGTLGILRLPDFYTRLHAAGITDTLGAELLLIAMMLQAGWSIATVKLLMISLSCSLPVQRRHMRLPMRQMLWDFGLSVSLKPISRRINGGSVMDPGTVNTLVDISSDDPAWHHRAWHCLVRNLFATAMLSGIYSLISAAVFVTLDAVDVAFTEAAVGAGVSTVLMLGAMTSPDEARNMRQNCISAAARDSWHRRSFDLWNGRYAALRLDGRSRLSAYFPRLHCRLPRRHPDSEHRHLYSSQLSRFRYARRDRCYFCRRYRSVVSAREPPREAERKRATRERQGRRCMTHHLILRVVSKLLIPFILVYALYVQFHGEYGPGGGFQAGAIFASGFVLYALIFGVQTARKPSRTDGSVF